MPVSWILKIKDMVVGARSKDDLLTEKRIAPRIHCFIDATFTTDNNMIHSGNIISLEKNGMRLLTPVRLAKGQKFDVSIGSYTIDDPEKTYSVDTVNAEVIWCRKKMGFPLHYAGVRFVDPDETLQNSWVYYVLSSYGMPAMSPSQRRRDIRIAASLPVTIYFLDKRGEKAHLTGIAYDISLGGMKINLVRDPGAAVDVTLHIGPYGKHPVLKCKGKTRRSTFSNKTGEYTLGIEFTELSEAEMKLLGDYVMTLLKEISL